MCGLVGIISKRNRPVGQQVYSLYKQQIGRGKYGYGYIAINKDGHITNVERAKTEEEIKKKLLAANEPTVLFHHRKPTSTENTLGTTHPMFISHDELDYDYYIAHNGVINNDAEVKAEHNKLGYVYSTEFVEVAHAVHLDGSAEELGRRTSVFNDSEALAIELARHMDGKTDEIKAEGAAAFWGIAIEKGGTKVEDFFFGTNGGRSLGIRNKNKFYAIASEGGSAIESMKIFSRAVVGSEQLYEQPMPMKKYEPKQTSVSYGYGYGTGQSWSIEDQLRNHYYSFQEALDTGVPLSKFTYHLVDGVHCYLPDKYIGYVNGRTGPDKRGQFQPESRPSEAIMGELEDRCMELAEIEYEMSKLEDSLRDRDVTYAEYEQEYNRLDMNMQLVQEKIDALGVPEGILDETMAVAKDVQDYSVTYIE